MTALSAGANHPPACADAVIPPSPLRWLADDQAIEVIDQPRLPHAVAWCRLSSRDACAEAIRSMQIRGAPLIGAVAAWGLVFALQQDAGDAYLDASLTLLAATRPTAVNLAWALARLERRLRPLPVADRAAVAAAEARALCQEDVDQNRRIGQHGLQLMQGIHARVQRPVRVLTHCNAGWLATVGWGTALAPVYLAHAAGVPVEVLVDETRPRNQGALTAWELGQAGIPHHYLADNAGGHLMQHGLVDIVLVGADRVSRQGDVCNKIGTYLKALAAQDNQVPFYAAVPSPTMDWAITDALHEIPIEERSAEEVRWVAGRLSSGALAQVQVSPDGSPCRNPAFDVTPARLITGLITEHGVFATTADGMRALQQVCQPLSR